MFRSPSQLRFEQLESRTLLAVNILAEAQPTRANSSSPRNFVPFGDGVIFLAKQEVWQSDGTETGTARLPWIPEARELSVRSGLLVAEDGNQVWRSDGTQAGTFVLGAGRVVGRHEDTLYLAQTERDAGSPLTVVAANVQTGEVQVLGQDVFNASFWRTHQVAVAGDVPVVVTQVIGDERPYHYVLSRVTAQNQLSQVDATEFAFVSALTNFNGLVYFLARFELNGNDRHGLFESDGHTIRRIQDFPPELYDHEVLGGLWATDDTLFVRIADSERSMQTFYLPANAQELRPLLLMDDECGDCRFHEIAGRTLISADLGVWSFDAATGAAERLIVREPLSFRHYWTAWAGPQYGYFTVEDVVYRTDGTVAGTSMFSSTEVGLIPFRFAVVDDRIVFGHSSEDTGAELWVSDIGGKARLLFDIDPTHRLLDISVRQQRVMPNGDFYFQLDDRRGLLSVTRAGTTSAHQVMGFHPRLTNTTLQGEDFGDLWPVGNQLCFQVRNQDDTYSFWATDGTPDGTVPLVEQVEYVLVRPSQQPHQIVFSVRAGDQDSLWVTECTPDSTVRIAKEFALRSEIVAFGEGVAFLGERRDVGREVWVSDLTPAGTRPVTEFQQDRIRIASIQPTHDAIYFSAGTDTTDVFRLDRDLVVTPIADLAPRGFQFGVVTVADLESRVVFRSTDLETTKSILLAHDLETNETRKLTATLGHTPRELHVLGSRAVYEVDNPEGVELWSTDGTEGGTTRLWRGPAGERVRDVQVVDLGGEGLIQVALRRNNVLLRSNGTPEGTTPVPLESESNRRRDDWLTGLVRVKDRVLAASEDAIVALDRQSNPTRIQVATAQEYASQLVPLSDGRAAIVVVQAGNGTYLKIYRTDGTHDGTYLLERVENPSRLDRTLFFATSEQEFFFRARSSQVGATVWTTPLNSAADFNEDGRLDGDDVDQLVAALTSEQPDPRFDLDRDGSVDQQDQRTMIEDVFETSIADVNLDGRVDFSDFLLLSDGFDRGQAGWGRGDLNGDGVVDFQDFLILADEFGFDRFGP